MPAQWSGRWATATFALLATILLVLTTFFIWPGILQPGCRFYSGPTEAINNRTYCYAIVSVRMDSYPFYANFTEWAFTFHLYFWGNLECGFLNVSVAEPNGTSYSGVLWTCAFLRPPTEPTWFASDNESGVVTGLSPGNATLLVEQ